MRVMLFAAQADAALMAALQAEGLELDHRTPPPADAPGASGVLISALRDAEQALAATRPAAVLVTGDGDAALAVALTAVKLSIPTAWLRPGGATGHPLVDRVADEALDATADAAQLAASVRALAAPTITAR